MSADLTSQTFGRLRVLTRAGNDTHGHALWLCVCECGAQLRTRGRSLMAGLTRSCGCLRAETMRRNRRPKARAA